MTCRDINELTPLAQKACRLFLEVCEKEGLDIFIVETYRSQERQNELYERGRTKLWDEKGNALKIVTGTKSSRHTSRRAWDIGCKGEILYDIDILKKAGAVAKSLGITWGGDWKSADMVHFEIPVNWKAPEEEKEVRYNNVEEIPEWGKETVQKLIDKGLIADRNALDLSNDMLRVFVILDRNKGI